MSLQTEPTSRLLFIAWVVRWLFHNSELNSQMAISGICLKNSIAPAFHGTLTEDSGCPRQLLINGDNYTRSLPSYVDINRITRRMYCKFNISLFFPLSLSLQVHFSNNLHCRNGYKDNRQRVPAEQVHVPAKSVELAGLCCNNIRLHHHSHRDEQSGRAANVPSVARPQDHLHNARYVCNVI